MTEKPAYRRRLSLRMIGPAAVVALLTTGAAGCAPAPEPSTSPGTSASPSPAASDPAPSPSATSETPEASFRAWLDASRLPDADVACSYMTDGLVTKMRAELAAHGVVVSDCATMITTSAQLYAALGETADVDVEITSESAERAELFVTYGSSDCGIVVLKPEAGRWIMTDQSEETCG